MAPGKKRRTDWLAARAYYESGHSLNETAAKFKVSRGAAQYHAKAESWSQDLSESIRKATDAKLAGVLATGDPVKTAAAIASEAERRASVVERHRAEWLELADLAKTAASAARAGDDETAFTKGKVAKILHETCAIRQANERKAWGLDPAMNQQQYAAAATATVNVRALSTEELEEIVRGGAVESAPA